MFISCSIGLQLWSAQSVLGNICQHQEFFPGLMVKWSILPRKVKCLLMLNVSPQDCTFCRHLLRCNLTRKVVTAGMTQACNGSINRACLHSWGPVPLAKDRHTLGLNGLERHPAELNMIKHRSHDQFCVDYKYVYMYIIHMICICSRNDYSKWLLKYFLSHYYQPHQWLEFSRNLLHCCSFLLPLITGLIIRQATVLPTDLWHRRHYEMSQKKNQL